MGGVEAKLDIQRRLSSRNKTVQAGKQGWEAQNGDCRLKTGELWIFCITFGSLTHSDSLQEAECNISASQ